MRPCRGRPDQRGPSRGPGRESRAARRAGMHVSACWIAEHGRASEWKFRWWRKWSGVERDFGRRRRPRPALPASSRPRMMRPAKFPKHTSETHLLDEGGESSLPCVESPCTPRVGVERGGNPLRRGGWERGVLTGGEGERVRRAELVRGRRLVKVLRVRRRKGGARAVSVRRGQGGARDERRGGERPAAGAGESGEH